MADTLSGTTADGGLRLDTKKNYSRSSQEKAVTKLIRKHNKIVANKYAKNFIIGKEQPKYLILISQKYDLLKFPKKDYHIWQN